MKLITEQQVIASDKKIVMLIADGLGGLPQKPGGPTELEAAKTPNLDRLAYEGCQGLLDPIGPGITPGSGPAHLALFGYNPVECNVGRGLLSALGLGFDLQNGDVAARGNFCTLDKDRNVLDRRAGRVPTAISAPLCEKLEEELNRYRRTSDAEIFVRSEKDHRFLLVMRGELLSDKIEDTDSQKTGVPPLKCQPLIETAAHSARIVDDFTIQCERILADQEQANGVLLRGFSHPLPLPSMADRFGLRAAALADYPMYRGLAKLVGMEVISRESSLEARYKLFDQRRDDYDFFFIHYKKTDATGEDGDFDAKVAAIEELDATLPALIDTEPDVLIVTGDHSTPAVMASHSWHPVPALIWGDKVRCDATTLFGEQAALQGSLGRMPTMHLMPIALAHAGKLIKFGA